MPSGSSPPASTSWLAEPVSAAIPSLRCCSFSSSRARLACTTAADTCDLNLRLSIMENTVFDILVYVFDRYMLEELPESTERDAIVADLTGAGFEEAHVARALDWLADLAEVRVEAGLTAGNN